MTGELSDVALWKALDAAGSLGRAKLRGSKSQPSGLGPPYRYHTVEGNPDEAQKSAAGLFTDYPVIAAQNYYTLLAYVIWKDDAELPWSTRCSHGVGLEM